MKTNYRMTSTGTRWRVERQMKSGFWMPMEREYSSEKLCRVELERYREVERQVEEARKQVWTVVDGPGS